MSLAAPCLQVKYRVKISCIDVSRPPYELEFCPHPLTSDNQVAACLVEDGPPLAP